MSTDLIRYDLLVQDALKGVVRKVLTDAARDGLPGDHHFYVSFRTGAPGVKISQRLRDKYPQDMTIVLQHQFWDLSVGETAFEVGLSFSSVAERLHVPFDALSGFFDPSVQFGLKFEPQEVGASETVTPEMIAPAAPATKPAPSEVVKAVDPSAKPALAKPSGAKSPVPQLAPKAEAEEPKPAPARKADRRKSDAPAEPPEAGAEVVSLDAFRKKS